MLMLRFDKEIAIKNIQENLLKLKLTGKRGSLFQDPAGNRTTRRSGTDLSPVHQIWPKSCCKAQ